jgi:4'-phosphopantetheinyl transferase
MPFLKEIHLRDSGKVSLWKIQEEANFFLDAHFWSDLDRAQFSMLKGKRQLEWVAVRHLAKLELGPQSNIVKDEFGKPFLDNTDLRISFSHSMDIGAFAWSNSGFLGLDVQRMTEKIFRIAHKFANPEEADLGNLEQLHLIWGAKEAMFKAYGKGGIDFLKNLKIEFGPIDRNGGRRRGWLEKREERIEFILEYHFEGNYLVVVALSDFTRLSTDVGINFP